MQWIWIEEKKKYRDVIIVARGNISQETAGLVRDSYNI